VATSIRLDPAIEQRLENLAAQTGRSKAYYLRELVTDGLEDLEDLYLAEQRLIDIRAGRSDAVALEEVMKRYGLES
jgi:RHH-type rel operon transcriptional repressor/antitoxin RelB